MAELNWRGLPVHGVDMWDSWALSLQDYQDMVETWDALRDIIEPQLGDMGMVLALMDHARAATSPANCGPRIGAR